ncbi:MAG: hypothetical protein H6582_07935 [Crocinitomicaceae bacterium]|nr:hypothetical protein [Crocinitomicaceae bacterium]
MKALITVLISTYSALLWAQVPDNVYKIDAKPNEVTSFQGKLENGEKIEDLSWASNSSVACFPGTQNTKFRGNHVLHYFVIPPHSIVSITVIPDDKNANMSIYGYQVGTSNYSVPPNLHSCVSCEAEHKWDYPKVGRTQDHTRTIEFNSIENSYNIFIGVAGAEGLDHGDYTLKIDLKSRVESTEEQQPLKIYSAKVEKGKIMTYVGDLADGCKILDLSWASRSSTACFPATQNSKFTGNHIFFVTEIPTYSDMEITVIPDDKNANMSIYAYQDGTSSTVYPPELSTCVSCEAEHKWDYPKRGKTQDHTRTVYLNAINHPYRVVIGIAGADGLTTGTFKLQIKVTAKK